MEFITANPLLSLILAPVIGSLVVIASRSKAMLSAIISAITSAVLIYLAFKQYGVPSEQTIKWAGFGIDLALKSNLYAILTIGCAGFFGLLISIYSASFLRTKGYAREFFALLLLSLSFVNGAVLCDNLVALLFFWEGLLVSLYAMIAIGGKGSFRAATKAFIIVGVSDLIMMAGVALTIIVTKTYSISAMGIAPQGLGLLAFLLLMIGAAAKGGAMPFHSWIPTAALNAPLSFMAFFPAAVEKLIGIYLLVTVCTRIFVLEAGTAASIVMMTLGSVTIVLAVLMALIQKDFKRLLSYHAISQVGYMILGIGTASPIGIAAGIFHMINNALYKSCLFLTGGAVEKQAGTTDLTKLGGLMRKMPITFACFTIAALAISGVPPFNGFFSKEMIYGAALERGEIFYLAALVGSFFTAASFLKLGHAAFVDKPRSDVSNVKEASFAMVLPMVVLAAICVLFGVFNKLPVYEYIAPALGKFAPAGEAHESMALIIISAIILTAAVVNHFISTKVTGSGLYASEPVRRAPVMSKAYDLAEKRLTDPYVIGRFFVKYIAFALWKIDRANDWIYDRLTVVGSLATSAGIRRTHSGRLAVYASWAIAGAILIVWIMLASA